MGGWAGEGRAGWWALASGLAAAALLLVYLTYIRGPAQALGTPPGSEGVRVIVPKGDIPAGTVLAEDKLGEKVVPKLYLPAGVVGDKAQAVGMVAAVPLYAGEPLLAARLARELAKPASAASFVPAGRVAFALPIQPGAAVGGVISAEDRIMLISTLDKTTSVLFAELRVLGVAGEAPFGGVSKGPTAPAAAPPSLSLPALAGPAAAPTPVAAVVPPGAVREGSKILILDLSPEEARTLAEYLGKATLYVALRSAQGR